MMGDQIPVEGGKEDDCYCCRIVYRLFHDLLLLLLLDPVSNVYGSDDLNVDFPRNLSLCFHRVMPVIASSVGLLLTVKTLERRRRQQQQRGVGEVEDRRRQHFDHLSNFPYRLVIKALNVFPPLKNLLR